MGALRQPKLTEPSVRKGPAVEDRKLDQYGRDPESAGERLRAQTDFEADSGYAPFYHAVLADLPRLASGAVCYAFVLVVNMLSYGRGIDKQTKRRYESTLPISTNELAELCRANVRDIQRQVDELSERGMISVKRVGRDRKVVISLNYRKWRELDDYAVWKRRQVVQIDSVEQDDAGDDEPLPISKEAVKVFKAPQMVRPGRATKARKIDVGIRELCVVNDSPHIDARIDAVIDSGRLTVSASFAPEVVKGESKANDRRHSRRLPDSSDGAQQAKVRRTTDDTHVVIPPDEGIANQVITLFDPLLQKSGSRLLSPDTKALKEACAELGAMPRDFLVHYVMTQRASRPISGPKAVAHIVKDARLHWEVEQKRASAHQKKQQEIEEISRAQSVAQYRKILANPDGWSESDLAFVREQLAELGG